MLLFSGKDVIDHIKKLQDIDRESKLFGDLPLKSLFDGFPELDAPAGEFPFMTFIPGILAAFGEKDLATGAEDDRSGSDADVIDAFFHAHMITHFAVTVQQQAGKGA